MSRRLGSVHFFNERFKAHKTHFILQSVLAFLVVLGVLIALGGVKDADIIAIVGSTSLGASAFIVFSVCNAKIAKPRRMLGGYITSLLVGGSFATWIYKVPDIYLHSRYFSHAICAAMAMGLTMLIMNIFDLEHPPAAGLAVALVLEPWRWPTMVTIVSAVLVILLLRFLLRDWLIELIG